MVPSAADAAAPVLLAVAAACACETALAMPPTSSTAALKLLRGARPASPTTTLVTRGGTVMRPVV